MHARIYKPARNAMQSGQAKTKYWILEYAPVSARAIDPLMGWTSSGDMNSQVRMRFEDLETAKKFATDRGLDYVVAKPNQRRAVLRKGGYGDNFATNRRAVWTH